MSDDLHGSESQADAGQESELEARLLQQSLDEVAGRAAPPDQLRAVLARVERERQRAVETDRSAGRSAGQSSGRSSDPSHGATSAVSAASPTAAGPPFAAPQTPRMFAAALVLFGIAVLIAAAVATRERELPSGNPDRVAAQSTTNPSGVVPPVASGPAPESRSESGPESGQTPVETHPLPKGADPADLAAMRSADAMLAAEQRLRTQLAEGRIQGIDRVLPFSRLASWDYQEGLVGAPQDVRDLDGSKVLMLGFMLPIAEVEGMREFLLVESLWSCCYGTPPNVNGLVRCVMPERRTTDYLFDPLKLVGTLRVKETVLDGYCVDVFQLHVDFLEVVE
ncbi:MAG: DUF3299 domain-containing protein [Planctomycetota bacterium]